MAFTGINKKGKQKFSEAYDNRSHSQFRSGVGNRRPVTGLNPAQRINEIFISVFYKIHINVWINYLEAHSKKWYNTFRKGST